MRLKRLEMGDEKMVTAGMREGACKHLRLRRLGDGLSAQGTQGSGT